MTTSFRYENFLFATPWSPSGTERPVQDPLGVMLFIRKLQHECFPQFTVLTGVREHAELLLTWIGLTEKITEMRKCDWPKNRRYRALEILWACSQLAAKGGDISAIEGILNLRRFEDFWESRTSPKVRLTEPSSTACFRNLSYGISPHYWTALTNWNLIERDGDDAKLTVAGHRFFDVLFPKGSKKQLETVKHYVQCWLDPKIGLSEADLIALAKYFPRNSKNISDTFSLWYEQAQRLSQTTHGVFPAIWQLVGNKLRSPESCRNFADELKNFTPNAPNLGYALRRWVEAQCPDLLQQSLKESLILFSRDCRNLEYIEGSARFILDAMVHATKTIKSVTTPMLAKQWTKWLTPLAAQFAFWLTACRNSELKAAFSSVSASKPQSLLEAVLNRHLEVKMSRAFIVKDSSNQLLLTDEMPPAAEGIENMLEQLAQNPSLPSDPDTENPNPENNLVWREYAIRDWHWQRFAAWMRLDAEAQGLSYIVTEHYKAIDEGVEQ